MPANGSAEESMCCQQEAIRYTAYRQVVRRAYAFWAEHIRKPYSKSCWSHWWGEWAIRGGGGDGIGGGLGVPEGGGERGEGGGGGEGGESYSPGRPIEYQAEGYRTNLQQLAAPLESQLS
uniref:Uncharacterized protein n=1 Tax=Knipowitschia caucasica TaxID=637954 RepID=A0AAV2J563_KNICA